VRGTLSLLDPDARLAGDAVLTLRNPRVTASGLTYDARTPTGLVPQLSGANGDPMGSGLLPFGTTLSARGVTLSSKGTTARHGPPTHGLGINI
jgi:hypothetical protein